MKHAQVYWSLNVIRKKVRMRVFQIHNNIIYPRTLDVEQASVSSAQAVSCGNIDDQSELDNKNNDSAIVREGSVTSDDVFLEDHIPYGSPSNPIDDCGVVEIDLVSTEVHTEFETVEEAEHYEGDYEAPVTHTESMSREYNIPEAEGELPIIIEENKAALNLGRNLGIMNSPVPTTGSLPAMLRPADKGGNKMKMTVPPPPNQMQILAASLAGKSLDVYDSFQSGNSTVSRKPGTQSISSS